MSKCVSMGSTHPICEEERWNTHVMYRLQAFIQSYIEEQIPIASINNLFYQMRVAKVFSKIDWRYGYHQVRIKEENIHKIAFWTRYGHYEFVVVSFGLTNAPATFVCLMNSVFS